MEHFSSINFENPLYFWRMQRKQKTVQETSENWGNQVFYILEWHIFWREWFDACHAKWDTLLRMLQMFLQHVHDNSISCLNVIYQFSVFPHSLCNLWLSSTVISEVGTIGPKSIIPNEVAFICGFIFVKIWNLWKHTHKIFWKLDQNTLFGLIFIPFICGTWNLHC